VTDQLVAQNKIHVMTAEDVEKVRDLEKYILGLPQTKIDTQHIFHSGIYSRTIKIPAGVVLTGALIKRSTTLIVCGDVTVFIGDRTLDLNGYYVLPASAGRKQAFYAKSDTYLTRQFATTAKTVEEAEEEFTDEAHSLFSRKDDYVNTVVVTGE